MSYFATRIDTPSTQPAGTFEGDNFEPIPKGTQCLAYIEDALTDAPLDGSEQYVSLKWRIHAPNDYKGRVIFQKLRIWDSDAKKRNRALMMLAAIDANAGGLIGAQSGEPTDELLARALPNKPMLIKLDVWEFEGKQGNWICAVAPKPVGGAPLPAPASRAAIDDSEIPF